MWYLAVFVPASDTAATTALAHAVWPDDPNGSQQLTVSLTDAQGNAWRGGNAAVTDTEIAELQGLAMLSSVRWYRYGFDGILGLAWPLGQASEGTRWGWTQSVAAAGLALVGDA